MSIGLAFSVLFAAAGAPSPEVGAPGGAGWRFVPFGASPQQCRYAGDAYVCPPAEQLGIDISESQSGTSDVDVEVVVAAGVQCLTPGVGLRLTAREHPVQLQLKAVRVVVDNELSPTAFSLGGAPVAADTVVDLKPRERATVAVADTGAGGCWRPSTVLVEVPLVVRGVTQLFAYRATLRANDQALRTVIRATPEPPPPPPLPAPPPGFDGTVPPPDTTPRTIAMVAGGGVGAAVGVGLGVLIAVARPDDEPANVLVPGVLMTGLFGLSGVGLGFYLVEPAPHPDAPAALAWLAASRDAAPRQAQHEAWVALQARAGASSTSSTR